jgi:thiamine-monophosphate kinase
MQDISDGLATDLAHICRESGVAGRLFAEKLPCSPLLDEAALILGQDKADLQLKGGEDYQLVLTAPAGRESALQTQIMTSLSLPLYPVGVIVAGQGLSVQRQDGTLSDISFQGYEH